MSSHGPDNLLEARVHAATWGEAGPRVLLIHAIGFDHRTWEGIVPALSRRYRLAAPDLPGHGESDKPLAVDYGLWALGARVLRLLDELGWEDAAFVGNSLGGGVSLSVALQAPRRVRALALVNSVGFRSGLPLVGRLAFMPLLPFGASLAPPLAVRLGLESARRRWGTVSGARASACNRYLRSAEGRAAFFRTLRQLYGPDLDEMAPHYRSIRCPTLVLHGEKDPLIATRHARDLAAAIPGSALVRVPRCGHFPQEEHPEVVSFELRRFLDRTARG